MTPKTPYNLYLEYLDDDIAWFTQNPKRLARYRELTPAQIVEFDKGQAADGKCSPEATADTALVKRWLLVAFRAKHLQADSGMAVAPLYLALANPSKEVRRRARAGDPTLLLDYLFTGVVDGVPGAAETLLRVVIGPEVDLPPQAREALSQIIGRITGMTMYALNALPNWRQPVRWPSSVNSTRSHRL